MTEDKKAENLMRGVKESLFAGLVSNPRKTVAEFTQEALTIEKTLDARTRQCNLPLQLCSISSGAATTTDAWREIIREVVREELRRMLPSFQQPQAANLMDAVQEEVQHALGAPSGTTASEAQAMTYAGTEGNSPPRRARKALFDENRQRLTALF